MLTDIVKKVVDEYAEEVETIERYRYYLEDEMIRLEKEFLEDSWRAYEYMTYEKRVR